MNTETFGPAILGLAVFGLLAMIVMPRGWQNWQGWAIISFAIIPGILLVITLPWLVFGLLFFAGVFAMARR
nr:hypothetical protein [uncultured Halomonas sp.]